MRAQAVALEAPRSPEPQPRPELGDFRFRALMGEADWAALPPAIRRRFSKRLAGGQTIVYAGEILESWTSRAGWWLAQAARLIGGPLPVTGDLHVPSVVTVTEDMATGARSGRGFTRAGRASRRSSTRPSASPVRPASKNMSVAASA